MDCTGDHYASELCHTFHHRRNLERKKELENKTLLRTWKGIMERKNGRESGWVISSEYMSIKCYNDI